MAKTNIATKAPPIFTHEGASATRATHLQTLRRSVLACLLWEDEFYEDGQSIAQRIRDEAALCKPEDVAALAIEARRVHGLRHAPLMLLLDLVRRGGAGVADTVASTIKRADEMAELVNLYWTLNPGKGLPAQLKRGLAKAFSSFDEYQLAKYDRDGKVRLRDVLFLTHPKPKDDEQAALFKRVANRELETPDTWEVALSGGADKKEAFERLLSENKLGYLALLRNLRNMVEAGVETKLVKDALLARKGADLVSPFRYVSAAKAAPSLEPVIDKALLAVIEKMPVLSGTTVVCVDVSGSMAAVVSAKSEVSRAEAAATLGAMVNGDVRMIAFASYVREVPPRRGLAGVDAIKQVVGSIGYGTNIGGAVEAANKLNPDRIIVITDEQSHDSVAKPKAKHAYMINVASYKNGVSYGNGWVHIDGFSEATLRYVIESEAEAAKAA